MAISSFLHFQLQAVDAEFYLFDTEHGKEVRELDVIQKFYWIDLLAAVVLSLSSNFPISLMLIYTN